MPVDPLPVRGYRYQIPDPYQVVRCHCEFENPPDLRQLGAAASAAVQLFSAIRRSLYSFPVPLADRVAHVSCRSVIYSGWFAVVYGLRDVWRHIRLANPAHESVRVVELVAPKRNSAFAAYLASEPDSFIDDKQHRPVPRNQDTEKGLRCARSREITSIRTAAAPYVCRL
jgi:hypothetical protein